MDNKMSEEKKDHKTLPTPETEAVLGEDYKSVKYTQKHIKVIMDSNAIPKAMDPQHWAESMDNGVILYDSLRGHKPVIFVVSGEEAVHLPELVDVAGEPVVIADLKARFDQDEFWNKELYMCRKSPVYFFTTYLSTQKKPMQTDINAYKESIGYTSDKPNDELSEILEKHSESITLERLQALRPVRDTLDAEYDIETNELLLKVSKRLRFNIKSAGSARAKITASIKKTNIATAPAELVPYVLPKGKGWDSELFAITDVDILVRLFYIVNVK